MDIATAMLALQILVAVCIKMDSLKKFPNRIWIECGASRFWELVEPSQHFCGTNPSGSKPRRKGVRQVPQAHSWSRRQKEGPPIRESLKELYQIVETRT